MLPLITVQDVNGLIKEYVKRLRVIILTEARKKAEFEKKVTEQVLDALKVNSEN
jgi:Asp-tRNA(Asn)/Glu-tRNA(Gln) amidotransferase A subunit family amidase